MDLSARQYTESYISARHHNPAWQLLASRRAPLVLGCLQALFVWAQDDIPIDDALQSLAEILAEYAHQDDYKSLL